MKVGGGTRRLSVRVEVPAARPCRRHPRAGASENTRYLRAAKPWVLARPLRLPRPRWAAHHAGSNCLMPGSGLFTAA